MVTLNPAKLLHLDHRVGSLKAGKDADIVLWGDHPLSVYAKSEKTMVDGVVYFDREIDKKRQQEIQAERARIIQKMEKEGKGKSKKQKPMDKERHRWHCDDY